MILSGDARAAGAWQTAALAMNNEVRRHSGDEALEGLRALLSATIAENGLGPMLAAAELATELIPQRDPWRPLALTVLGVTRFISGDQLRADRALLRAVEAAAKTEVTAKVIALAYRAVLACDRGEWSAAETHAHDARVLVIQHDMTDYAPMILIDALSARVATRRGNRSQAIADVKHARAIRPDLSNTIPWLAVQARLELARASLALGDAPNALHLLEEADRMLDRVPALGRLNADADEIRGHAEQSLLADSRVSALTTAELRLLPYLATHLSFPRLGERLGLSESTVKTHAISIYRKLDASSRDEAVEAAVHVGLLDPIGPSVGFRRTA
jgi:LuxR family maltose regulon positive regulatory protein